MEIRFVIFQSLLLIGLTLSCSKQNAETASQSGVPERVVSLAPSVTELIYAIGESDKLVGVTRFCDLPGGVTNLPRVGDMTAVDYETVLRLKPDLVVASYSGNVRENVERLKAMGLRVLTLKERTVIDILSNVAVLGDTFGTDTTALRESLSERLARAGRIAEGVRHPAAMVVISADPIYSASTRTFVSDLIERAGYSNVVNSPVAYPVIDRENFLRYKPEVLLVSSELADEEDSISNFAASLGVDCRIVTVNADRLSRPSTGAIDLVLEMASELVSGTNGAPYDSMGDSGL